MQKSILDVQYNDDIVVVIPRHYIVIIVCLRRCIATITDKKLCIQHHISGEIY